MRPPAAIMETALYADDLDAAEAFYRDVFGLEVVRRLPGQFIFFRCGQQMLLIFDPEQSRRADPDNPIPVTARWGKAISAFTPRTSRRWTAGRRASKRSEFPSSTITAGRMTAIPSISAIRRVIRWRLGKANCGGLSKASA